jgi:hydroxypyruvate isomerase
MLCDECVVLDRLGYSGWVGLEYAPSVATDDSLAWLRASGFWER